MAGKHITRNKRSRDRARKARREAREVREMLKMPVESQRGLERRSQQRRRLVWKGVGWLGFATLLAVGGVWLFQRWRCDCD